VLGPVGIAKDGDVEPIRSDKQRILLAHLALADGAPVHERILVNELWDEPPANPRHALQAHVSRLRQATELPIEHSAGGYRLSHQGVVTDAAEFEKMLRRAHAAAGDGERVRALLSEAIALWRGSALENLPTTPGVHGERTRLHLLYDRAVTELIDAHLEAGQATEALPLLYEAVETNPGDERRWGQLMVALDDTGQRSEALAVFARARNELVDHLGLDPGERLQQIHHAILTGSHPARVRPPHVRPPLDPPGDVVGRDAEWAILTRLWAETPAGQRVAVVSGEPGIGKTYLAQRFASMLPAATAAGPIAPARDPTRFWPTSSAATASISTHRHWRSASAQKAKRSAAWYPNSLRASRLRRQPPHRSTRMPSTTGSNARCWTGCAEPAPRRRCVSSSTISSGLTLTPCASHETYGPGRETCLSCGL